MNETREHQLHLYRLMTRVRAFEEEAANTYKQGKLPGFLHLSIGQEAVSVGACAALRADDYMASTHRGHGDTIAKGVSVEAAIAELFGRVTGTSRGKGGSMHIADFDQGILGANGIVGAGIPIAIGAAVAVQYRKTDQVALAFFGDGATGAGPVHESLNMASLWKLPMIFVRQNNRYAESTPLREGVGIPDIVAWASAYGIHAERVDGNDVLAVHAAVDAAVARARAGAGPSFIECETYRWFGHNIGDPGTGRPKEEVEEWRSRDPVARYHRCLIDEGVASEEQLGAIAREERDRVLAAIESAEAAPLPEVHEALEGLYVDAELGRRAIQGVRP
jgi:TPP-dependent pyruvate/acetoin dehydrogenase alpha subunit